MSNIDKSDYLSLKTTEAVLHIVKFFSYITIPIWIVTTIYD